jgi:uncharacterized membrane protein YbhN (UPF0104 family)
MSADNLAPAPADQGRKRRLVARVLPLVRPVVAVLILAAIIFAVTSEWSGSPGKPGIRDAVRALAWPSVVLSLLAVFAGTVTSVLAWRALLADEGHPLTPIPAARIFLVGQLAKYLPGSVWSVVLQADLATRERVPRGRAFTTSLAFVGLSLSTGLTVGLLGVPVLATAHHAILWWLLAAWPLLVIASLPPVLTRLVNLVLRLLRRSPLPRQLSWSGVLAACGWLTGTWILFGVHLWLLANAVGAPGMGGLVRSVGGFALAMTAGVVFVIAPSGAGIREIVIVAALAPVMASAEAFGLAVVSRVLFIIVDVTAAGAAAISARRQLRYAPAVAEGESGEKPAERVGVSG